VVSGGHDVEVMFCVPQPVHVQQSPVLASIGKINIQMHDKTRTTNNFFIIFSLFIGCEDLTIHFKFAVFYHAPVKSCIKNF
jgi:hypothetical protein